jgi:N-acylneuraminate cytidylyltransferase
MFWPEHRLTRSQDLEEAFHDAGQFFWGRRDAWVEQRPIFTERSHMFLVPRYRVQDLDTLEDWQRAERIVELMQQSVD